MTIEEVLREMRERNESRETYDYAFDVWADAIEAAMTRKQESYVWVLRQREDQNAEIERLREAGQAVVDRWHTPNWKDVEATGMFINRLEAALAGKEEAK